MGFGFFSVQKDARFRYYKLFNKTILSVPRASVRKKRNMYKKLTKHTILKTDGISIQGYLQAISGEGKVARVAAETLNQSGINYDVVGMADKRFPLYETLLTFSTKDYYKHPRYKNIPLMLWEFESGMPEIRPYAFEQVSAVATFSHFCAKYFKKIAPKGLPIIVLPYPMDMDLSALTPVKAEREKYGIKPRDFVFFFNFSYCSSYFRKNPEGTLAAFAKAFPKHDKNVKLVIKTICSGVATQNVQRLQNKISELGLDNNIILINQDLTDTETYSLINCCDAYVSLHRGEGLGLGMMEAMYMGKPVIATNYGGNTEFTKPDNSLLVDYKMISPKEIDLVDYKYVQKWPEPNIDTACKHMQSLYKDAKLRKQLGLAGAKFIRLHFNKQKFNDAIKELLS